MKSLKSLVLSGFTMLVVMFALVAVIDPHPAFADEQQTVTIPASQLTTQQKADLDAKALADKTAQYGKWVGMGDELGKAINSSLSAITTQANVFAGTPVGKWTIFIVVFKVLGNTLFGYVFGIIMAIFGTSVWLWSYRKWLPRQVVSKITYAADGKTKQTVEYTTLFVKGNDKNYRGDSDDAAELASYWLMGHWGLLIIWWVCIFVVMFSGS